MKLGFIGFGEAAQAMARGFAEAGGTVQITACDIRATDPAHGPQLASLARELNVALTADMAQAIQGCGVVLSMVQASASIRVAEAAAPHLRAGQVFVDLNSASPLTKVKVHDAIISGGAGTCLEGAIMDAVKPKRHKVPILLAGPGAAETCAILNAIGMACEPAGDRIGQACSVKMIRSVMIKGVEALILESMGAAETAGVTGRILQSLNGTFPGLDWHQLTSHYLKRTHEHGPRRVSEMKEAAATLAELGLEPFMSTAIAKTIAAGHAALAARPYDPAALYPDLLPMLAADPARAAGI